MHDRNVLSLDLVRERGRVMEIAIDYSESTVILDNARSLSTLLLGPLIQPTA